MTTTTLRARTAAGWRSTTGDAALVARRRSRQDAGLLALAAVVLAVTVLIALAVPRIVLRTADAGVQGAVRDAGPAADVVAVLGSGHRAWAAASAPTGGPTRVDNAATLVANAATSMATSLPEPVQAATGPVVTAVRSAPLTARLGDDLLATRLVHLGTPTTTEPVVRWVDRGRAAHVPRAPGRLDGPAPRRGRGVGRRRGPARPRRRAAPAARPGRPAATPWPS